MIAATSTSRRLRLLPLAATDLPLFRDLYCDADTMEHVGKPLTRGHARTSFRATLLSMREPAGPVFFRIESRRARRACGICALQRVDALHRRVELGILLLAAGRNRGYATEAMRVVIDFAFRTLPIEAVWVQYRLANAAAARLFAGLGFRPAAVCERRLAQRTRCVATVQRSAWRDPNQPTGESTHVEHDPFSRERGPRRRPAPRRRKPSARNDA